MDAKLSRQHSSVVTQGRPGSVQPGAPPKQRKRPALFAWQTVDQHPALEPGAPHGSPAVRHAPTMAHWPLAVPPGRSHSLLQHCESAVHASPTAMQAMLGALASDAKSFADLASTAPSAPTSRPAVASAAASFET